MRGWPGSKRASTRTDTGRRGCAAGQSRSLPAAISVLQWETRCPRIPSPSRGGLRRPTGRHWTDSSIRRSLDERSRRRLMGSFHLAGTRRPRAGSKCTLTSESTPGTDHEERRSPVHPSPGSVSELHCVVYEAPRPRSSGGRHAGVLQGHAAFRPSHGLESGSPSPHCAGAGSGAIYSSAAVAQRVARTGISPGARRGEDVEPLLVALDVRHSRTEPRSYALPESLSVRHPKVNLSISGSSNLLRPEPPIPDLAGRARCVPHPGALRDASDRRRTDDDRRPGPARGTSADEAASAQRL